MPLTPADVHNVAFKKPPIGKRGYDEEEVDSFLDEIERELARLIEENNDLKGQVERAQRSRPGTAPAAPAPAPAHVSAEVEQENARLSRENTDLKSQVQRLEQQLREAAARAAERQAAPPPAADEESQALSVLMTAQRTANEHVTDARREADKLLSDARTKAEEVTREARNKADALERDARQRHQEAMGGLEIKRTALQKHIEELKNFEREYRTRLKAYLESQMRDLDGRGQSLESELGRTPSTVSVNNSSGYASVRSGQPDHAAQGSDSGR